MDRIDDVGICQQADVGIKNLGDCYAEARRGLVAQFLYLGDRRDHRLVQAFDLSGDSRAGDRPTGDPLLISIEDEGWGNGHPGRDRNTSFVLHLYGRRVVL